MNSMKKPTLYILCGLPFSGKTALAKKLSDKLGFVHIDLDEVKFEHGFRGVSDDDVSHEDWVKIFDDMYQRIRKALKEGHDVISDISNLERSDRDRLRTVATGGGFPTKVIYLNIPESVVRERWLQNKKKQGRFDISEKIFNEAVGALEEPTEDENVIVFDQSLSLKDWIEKNLA